MAERREFPPTNWQVVSIGKQDLYWGGIDYHERGSLNALPLSEIERIDIETWQPPQGVSEYAVVVRDDDGHLYSFTFARATDAQALRSALENASIERTSG